MQIRQLETFANLVQMLQSNQKQRPVTEKTMPPYVKKQLAAHYNSGGHFEDFRYFFAAR
jgi:hypothetical protein